MAQETVERFAPNGGTPTAVAGGVVAVVLIVLWVVDPAGAPLWVLAVGLVIPVLVWATVVRPRVWVEPGSLVLRNALSTTWIPLAAIEEVAVRQVMAVRVGGKRYVNPGVGRSLRQAMRGSAAERVRSELGGLQAAAAAAPVVEPGMIYGDFVELRLRDLIAEDRSRRGVAAYSAGADMLADDVRRSPAYVEMGLVVASLAFLVLSILLG